MKHKFLTLLSLGLFFGMFIQMPAAAAPTVEQNQSSIDITAHDIGVQTEMTFSDCFPDPVFAESVANCFKKTKDDITTTTELLSLKYLRFDKKDISSIEGIGLLKNLVEVELMYNQLTEIPAEIGNLTKLTRLSAGFNKIEKLPAEIGNLTNLDYIYLWENCLTELPAEIGNLKKVTQLVAGKNQLTELPAEIVNMERLRSLHLDGNQITELPENIGELTNLVGFTLNDNNITEIPASINNMPILTRLWLSGNQLISALPEASFTIDTLDLGEQQPVTLPAVTIPRDDISYQQLVTPFMLQMQSLSGGSLPGAWAITSPDGTVLEFDAVDGSEIQPSLFRQLGTHQISYLFDESEGLLSLTKYQIDIPVYITNTNEKVHDVHLTVAYTDHMLPATTQSYLVEDGGRFEQKFEVLDGYELANAGFSIPVFDVDMDTKTVSLAPVTSSYKIYLEFEKEKPVQHKVTVITKYLDDALPEHTETYSIEHGSSFLAPFEVLKGYDLYNFTMRSQPVFDVDMETNEIRIDVVEKPYTIVLEFDKLEYKVKLTTVYLDNHLSETTYTDWVRYEENYSRTYEIAEGYQVANLDKLPAGVTVDERGNTVALNNVTQDQTITLEFEKKEHQVIIQVIYEDGIAKDQITTYTISHGESFEESFTIEPGYAIKKISFNATGVSVNRSRQTVSILQVTGPVEVMIQVR